jgi:hypothetical protein
MIAQQDVCSLRAVGGSWMPDVSWNDMYCQSHSRGFIQFSDQAGVPVHDTFKHLRGCEVLGKEAIHYQQVG